MDRGPNLIQIQSESDIRFKTLIKGQAQFEIRSFLKKSAFLPKCLCISNLQVAEKDATTSATIRSGLQSADPPTG